MLPMITPTRILQLYYAQFVAVVFWFLVILTFEEYLHLTGSTEQHLTVSVPDLDGGARVLWHLPEILNNYKSQTIYLLQIYAKNSTHGMKWHNRNCTLDPPLHCNKPT